MTTDKNTGLSCMACDGACKPLFDVDGIPVTRCEDCGLGAAHPEAFDPEKYYDAGYFSGNRHDGYVDYQGSESTLRREFRKTVHALIRQGVPEGSVMLEVGCAYGYFLAEASKYYKVHGLEISDDAVGACHARGLASVVQGSADSTDMTRFPVLDAVVMLDVIEHLENPLGVMGRTAARLRPGGVMALTTGDFSSLASRVGKERWRLMTPPQHLWFFTPDSFRHIARKLGLEVVSIQYPWKHVPMSLIIYQLLRSLRRKPRIPAVFSQIGVPVNVFDAMRVVLRKA